MNLKDSTTDLFVCHLWKDYLSLTQEAYAALTESEERDGLPDNLPRWVMDTGKEPPRPVFVVAAHEDGSRGPRRSLMVTVMLLTRLQTNDANAATDDQLTTREEAMKWLGAAQRRCQHEAALSAWLQSLPEERRKGWTIMKLFYDDIAKPRMSDTKATVAYGFVIRMHLAVSPH